MAQKLYAETVFADAIAIASPQARAAFLDQACQADPAVRAEVERLVADYFRAGDFLEQPVVQIAAPTLDPLPCERPGTEIGPYELLEQIGEGGMGVVYLAVQAPPIQRQVALKIIKPGMDTREVVTRFEAERQALALMDHPNIARVFDGGATATGRPYFVMELVRGIPITEFCDQQKLTTRERLALFVTVCHGVQHAHQKGVIHRDIKPSNVLVEVHDVRPVPKIIDFGVAKATGPPLTDAALRTGFHQMVGTPLYMSPEQAGQSSLDVDTRSDIYSLGVVLYEMLTGTTPFARDTLHTADYDELRRMICEVDPPRPSARISTLRAGELSTISDRRRIEPRKLRQQLRGELDWIVMKALDKDRTRRYATANGLAADVERYLRDEPVEACPPSATYRFTKFARRNRAALVTGTLVALALIASTGVSVWQVIRATRAERAAIAERDEKEQQARRATLAEQRTAKALLTAEERLQFGRQAVNEMYTQVAEKWLAQQAEMTPLQEQFLEKALAFYQRLATEENNDSAVRFESAKAQQRVGEIQRKLGKHTEAEAAFRRAVALFEPLAREARDPAPCNQALAGTHESLAALLGRVGQVEEAEREARLALDLRKALVNQSPSDTQFQIGLAETLGEVGSLLNTTGRSREAEDTYREGVAILESLLTRSPDDRDLKYKLTRSQFFMARTIPPQVRLKEIEALDRLVLGNAAALVADDPKNPEYRVLLANCHNALGNDLLQLNCWPESEASHRQAMAIRQRLAEEFPDMPFYRAAFAQTLGYLGNVLDKAGKTEELEQILRETVAIKEKLAAEHPEVPDFRNSVGGSLNNLATALMNRGAWEEARGLLEQAVAHEQAALKVNPTNKYYRQYLSTQQSNLAAVQLKLGDQDAAARTANDSARQQLLNRNRERLVPNVVSDIEMLFSHVESLRRGQQDSERRETLLAGKILCAKALIRQTVEITADDPKQCQLADLLTTAPEELRDPELGLQLARKAVALKPEDGMCLQSLGWALYRAGDWKASVESIKKQSDTAHSGFVLAMAYWQLGEKTEALAQFDRTNIWLNEYEQLCAERVKQRFVVHPSMSMLRRLQTEAATLLGVAPPVEEPASEPAAKAEEESK